MPKFNFPWERNTPKTAFDQPRPGSGSITQKLRLWSGLVLMVYAILHFTNHALGNISLESMEQMKSFNHWVWNSWAGSILLYGSFITHIALIAWKLLLRKTLRMPAWEWMQIILGLLIPYLLLTHIIAMRGTTQMLGIHMSYNLAFLMMWKGVALKQSLLLLIVWIHGCVGIHFWLRLRQWYIEHLGWLATIATLIPALALTGWINGARMNLARLDTLSAEEVENYFATVQFIYSEILPKINTGKSVLIALGVSLVVGLVVQQVSQRLRKRIKINYGDNKIVTSFPGKTILEISRSAGIGHIAVCGGRARCSTCRTLIIAGGENLQPVTPAESVLLKRLNAEGSIRLACQAKVNGNIKIRPLVQPQDQQNAPTTDDQLGWGVERPIAILFLDIRGFSKISEKSLPYDVVFILNSFFGEISSAVEAHHGYVDKFMGDGMMALFGLADSETEASRNALLSAIACVKSTATASRILTQHLDEPIKIGIGVHTGDAVIGKIGRASNSETSTRLTAIGDSVNVSSRLEQATKEFGVPLVISTHTAIKAGLSDLEQYGLKTEIIVHNISRPVEILAVENLSKLEEALSLVEMQEV